MIITSRMKEENSGDGVEAGSKKNSLMFSRSTCFKRSDKFSDIRTMKRSFLWGFLHGFHCNMCGLEYGELTQNDRCLSRSWKQLFINYTFIKAN